MSKQREYKQCKEKLAQMIKEKHNKKCADCGCKTPTWTSQFKEQDVAVFICARCAGIHRGIGVHITFVQSTTLDKWDFAKFNRFKSKGGGNNVAINALYEAKLPKYLKPDNPPNDHDHNPAVKKFIKAKYIERRWYSNKSKKSKRKNTSQPLLEKKEKIQKNKASNKEKYEEKKSDDYKALQHKLNAAPDLLSPEQMQAIAPNNDASDIFDDMFYSNKSSMNNGNVSNSKQNIMNMYHNNNNDNNSNNNNGHRKQTGHHNAFNPDFNQNNYKRQQMIKYNHTGNYKQGLIAMNNIKFANNAQQIENLWNNNNNSNTDSNWNVFDDNGQNKRDSKSIILQQYKQKASDNFMASIYATPQYINNNQYVNNNNYRMKSNVSKNDGYKKNNYKPMNNNNYFSTVTQSDELFSEFKI